MTVLLTDTVLRPYISWGRLVAGVQAEASWTDDFKSIVPTHNLVSRSNLEQVFFLLLLILVVEISP